jgi:hypothetical protein
MTTTRTTDGLTDDMCLALHILVTEGDQRGFEGELHYASRDLAHLDLVVEDRREFTLTEAGHAAYTPAVKAVAERMQLDADIANEDGVPFGYVAVSR